MEHKSVLRNEVQNYLDVKNNELVVDATLGLGGHALDILQKLGANGVLMVFEQDERNLVEAQRRLKSYEKQVRYIHDNFRHLKNRIAGEGYAKVDKIFYDLGLSSPHVDEQDRGFSFMKSGPLDMRYDLRTELTAHEIINFYPEERLRDIFFEYGEEKFARLISGKICDRRKTKLFEDTLELADFISASIPKKFRKNDLQHPATRVFQSLRIEVNDELNVLKESLDQAFELLKVSGRLVVISYHSIEDRIVKQFFKSLERPEATGEMSKFSVSAPSKIKVLTRKPVIPSDEEINVNKRSRSAKLRAFEKILN